ncbi:MAG TPA: YraN family protein [Candidatus Methanoperedens sp.]|nr:YraN family protein [Candidatus Methanoperedens sp.]
MEKAKNENYHKGQYGENIAKEYLLEKGFVFIEANFENKIGEIDLIMSDKKWLVFVEVKYKSDDRLGIPEEMINRNKICQVKRVAESYLIEKKVNFFEEYRIDAVCILGNEVRHYENVE